MFNNGGPECSATGLEGLEPEEVAGDPAKGEVAQAPANALMLRRATAAGRRGGLMKRLLRAVKLLMRDGRIPRPLRGLAAFGLLPIRDRSMNWRCSSSASSSGCSTGGR